MVIGRWLSRLTNALLLLERQQFVLKNDWKKSKKSIVIHFYALRNSFRRKIVQIYCRTAWKSMELYAKPYYRRTGRTALKQPLVLGTAGLVSGSSFDWENQRISDAELFYHFNEISHTRLLLKMTLFCPKCKRRISFEANNSGTSYCACSPSTVRKFKNWEPFFERTNLIVWKKTYKTSFKYRVYGKYKDVSALNFLRVQIDLDYRRKWDASAESLSVVEKDPNPVLNSDIVYWEMKWPMFFENRDFVFNRRFIVHKAENVIVIMNKVTEHPQCPEIVGKKRILNYWSCMVIKPLKSIDEDGMEFCLTYFDDPGISLPSKVTDWVTMKAMPDFLSNVHAAAKSYENYCNENALEPIEIHEFHESNGADHDDNELAFDHEISAKSSPSASQHPHPQPHPHSAENFSFWNYQNGNFFNDFSF